MELILGLSLFLNFCFGVTELKNLYLEYKYKKNIQLLYNNE